MLETRIILILDYQVKRAVGRRKYHVPENRRA